MQLKSLEIGGFKSFGDRTSLNFGEGITAIVGPNGCGKTNITDAIKWVLGEQSAKSLRGTKMEDVIFNGTASRKPSSATEITLTFDNSKNVLPIDYSEVCITRRLFRTGESEYLLNKTPVRLRDIRDLFMDTGVGTESYSIMEQGKIDFILQSKPEERRYIFEEAAGVAKYKSKREEALRKLERVGQDMLRLNDILTELESQKSKLDTQARKARQYQKYLAELKNYEVNSLVGKYIEAREINDSKQKELDKTNEALSQISLEIDKLDARYSELKLELISKEDELIQKRTEVGKIDSVITVLEERIQSSESAKADLTARDEEAEQDISQGQEEQVNFEKEFNAAKVELEEAEKIVSGAEEILSKKTEAKAKLSTEIAETNSGIENLRQEIFNCATELSELHNKKNTLEAFLKDIASRIEKQKVQEQETIAKEALQKQNIAFLVEKIDTIDLDIKGKKEEEEVLSAKINRLRADIEKEQEELLSKKENAAHLSAQMEALSRSSNHELNKNIIETFKGRIYGTVSDVIKVSAEHVSVVQSALTDKSDYLICDTENTALEVINWLRSARTGWASFLIISEINKLQTLSSEIFSGRKISELVDCEQKFRKVIDFVLSDATLKNDNIHNHGVISGGAVQKGIRGGLEIAAEINRMSNEYETVNSQIEKIKNSLENHQTEIESTETALNANRSSLETLNNQLLAAKTEFSAADESLKTSVNFLAVLTAEFDNLEGQKTEKESESSAMLEQITEKALREKTAKSSFSELDKKIKTLRTELEKEESEFTNIQIDFSVKDSQLENIRKKIKTCEYSVQQVTLKVERSKKWLEESAKKTAAMEKVVLDSQAEIDKIIVTKDSADDILQKIERGRDEIKGAMSELENNLRNLRGQQKNIQEECRTLERSVSGTSSEMRQIETRLKEEKGISIDEAVNNFQEISIEHEEVEKLKKKIELLGAVNLAAPEEYEQLEQRYNFLTKQKADLEKGREDLHNAINKINATTRQNFQKTFNVVRDNFRNIFNRLFEGGEADLILTDEGNLLETGIDIIAQPPGKKLQHISLLSGGERSLTAIAILFAIYLVKPAPFCILDEIDGQLDEANVLRFTRMLKEFAQISQFFVITHNKRTMESANALYGITMEEMGISKIISVHLEGEKVPVAAASIQ